MGMLREAILQAEDRPVMGPFHVPEWDTNVWMRTLDTVSLTKFADKFGSADTMDGSGFAELLEAVLCDEEGEPALEPGDSLELLKKNGDVILRLGMEALKVCGLTKEAVEEAAGN